MVPPGFPWWCQAAENEKKSGPSRGRRHGSSAKSLRRAALAARLNGPLPPEEDASLGALPGTTDGDPATASEIPLWSPPAEDEVQTRFAAPPRGKQLQMPGTVGSKRRDSFRRAMRHSFHEEEEEEEDIGPPAFLAPTGGDDPQMLPFRGFTNSPAASPKPSPASRRSSGGGGRTFAGSPSLPGAKEPRPDMPAKAAVVEAGAAFVDARGPSADGAAADASPTSQSNITRSRPASRPRERLGARHRESFRRAMSDEGGF